MSLRQRLLAFVRAPWAPFALLGVVCVLSLAARAAWLGSPCSNPCRGLSAHSLVFDEVYYVNAARRIDGLTVPAKAPYADDPAGQDSNSEHPQFVKLFIAGAIKLFGDGPFAWRVGSLLFGTVAILGHVRARARRRSDALDRAARGDADGGRQPDAGARPHRDARHLRRRVHGLGRCAVSARALDRRRGHARGRRDDQARRALPAARCSSLVEVLRHRRRRAARRPGARSRRAPAWRSRSTSAVLAIFDRIAPPYDPQTGTTIRGGPLAHTAAHVQLRGRADEPARAAGDRVLSVGLARRPQADQLPRR